MVLSMKQIKLLLLFFHSLNSEFKGIKNLLEKIEFYNENDHILEEKDQSDDLLFIPTKYYLFLKEPALKEIKIEKTDSNINEIEL